MGWSLASRKRPAAECDFKLSEGPEMVKERLPPHERSTHFAAPLAVLPHPRIWAQSKSLESSGSPSTAKRTFWHFPHIVSRDFSKWTTCPAKYVFCIEYNTVTLERDRKAKPWPGMHHSPGTATFFVEASLQQTAGHTSQRSLYAH